MQYEINNLLEENQQLNNNVNELKMQNSVLVTNIEMLEKEKGRHLEQNALVRIKNNCNNYNNRIKKVYKMKWKTL